MCSISRIGQWNNRSMTGKFSLPMQIFRTTQILLTATLLMLLGMFSLSSATGEVSVQAELSRPEVNAGEMSELQVRVSGTEVTDVPHEIPVEGLQISLTGQSTQVQMDNFKVSSSQIYSYIVMPLRTGHFTIPSISIRSNAGMLSTAPLVFSVIGGGTGASSVSGAALPQGNQPPLPGMPGFTKRAAPRGSETERLAFAEINSPKKTLYVGEMMPVEIRYYFDASYPVQVLGKVDFGSEGIIVERFPDPKESREDREGTTYNVLTFRTLMSAVKPGSIDITPAKLNCQIQMPGSLPPAFDDPVFQQLMGGKNPMSETRDLVVKTASLHLQVLPLPKEGRPSSFAGAVGQFDSEAVVAHPKLAPGDPAVLSIKIEGKGNFKAMSPPILTETEGWRSYPPADKFDSTDELSFAGVKSFDFTLIAQQPQKNSPGSEFSYFDPVTAKYVTLTTKGLPLEASPGIAPPSGVASPLLQAAFPVPKAPPLPLEEGALSTQTLHSWKTPMQRSEFLLATLAMVIATLALVGSLHVHQLQKQGGSPEGRRRRRLRELLASLNSETLDAAAAYDAALEYAELIRSLSADRDVLIAEITARRDMLKYGVGRSVALSQEERERLQKILRTLSAQTSR